MNYENCSLSELRFASDLIVHICELMTKRGIEDVNAYRALFSCQKDINETENKKLDEMYENNFSFGGVSRETMGKSGPNGL